MEGGPYADLYLFNTTTTRLLDLVNTFLNDPFNDSDNLRALQPMVTKLVEDCEELIKRKANRAIAEMIVQNFNEPSDMTSYSTEIPVIPGLSMINTNKRKASDSDIYAETTENQEMQHVLVGASKTSFITGKTIPNLIQSNQNSSQPPRQLPNNWVVDTPRKDDWTDFDIRRLRSVVSQFGESWYDVAVYMNCGLTAKQCCDKWTEIKDHPEIGRLPDGDISTSPSTISLPPHSKLARDAKASSNASNSLVGMPYKTPPQFREWLQYEVIYLKELVVKFKQGPKGRRFINWSLVAQALNREEVDCKDRYNHMILTKVKKGPYKPEEDERIVKLVRECLESGAEGVGNEVWEQLEKEMGRPAKNIRLRWRITLSRRSVTGGAVNGFYFNGSTVRIDGDSFERNGGSGSGSKGGESDEELDLEEEEQEDLEEQEEELPPSPPLRSKNGSSNGKSDNGKQHQNGSSSRAPITSTRLSTRSSR